MEDFDYDGFLENVDLLDDGFDHEDEYGDGFHEFSPAEEIAV